MMEHTIRQFANRLGLGPVALQLYYAPKGFMKKCVNEGPMNLYLANRGKQEMEEAARTLPKLDLPRSEAPMHEVHFLTGEKFWYQTAFCAWSLMQTAGRYLTLVVYDDGSLKEQYIDQFRRLFPSLKVIPFGEIEERIESILPENKFPVLRERRINYPHIRKLTDVHAGLTGWKLVLDSDMLFFREAESILNWLENPVRPFHMHDTMTAYGYSKELMEELAGKTMPNKLNVGMCGLRSEELDWELLEFWAAEMIKRENTSYYQEQALVAMLLAERDCEVAPPDDYICLPDCSETQKPTAVLHHYVASSKNWYFRFGWRNAMELRTMATAA